MVDLSLRQEKWQSEQRIWGPLPQAPLTVTYMCVGGGQGLYINLTSCTSKKTLKTCNWVSWGSVAANSPFRHRVRLRSDATTMEMPGSSLPKLRENPEGKKVTARVPPKSRTFIPEGTRDEPEMPLKGSGETGCLPCIQSTQIQSQEPMRPPLSTPMSAWLFQ